MRRLAVNRMAKAGSVLIMVTLVASISACTKTRDAQFPSGQGLNLQKVSAFDGKTFDIQTFDAIKDAKTPNVSNAQKVDVDSKAIGNNRFAILNYEVSDKLGKELMAGIVITGLPKTKYQGLVRLSDSKLEVFKVGAEDTIPTQERTYATRLPDGSLAVPLVSYNITGLYTVDKQRNDRGETTTTLYEKPQTSLAAATHFRYDKAAHTLFEPVVKTDVFPKGFFDGEWFYSETITAAPEEDTESLGYVQGYDQTLAPSSRVKFLPTETSMNVVNLNIDERLIKDKNTNFKKALSIPATWVEYRVLDGTMDETLDMTHNWGDRPFVQLDMADSTSEANKGKARLVALEARDDYFSFTVETPQNQRYKYSFLRAKPTGYVAKRYFKDDRKIFGFFDTTKSVVYNYEISRQEDIEKNVLISRFNPAKTTIVYHFTKSTPDWIRPAVRQAIAAWDETFQAAGTGMHVAMDESFDVDLGDLRYNTINVIESLTSGNLLGYGPSVTDPTSGEIIAATANVHVTPIRAEIITEIRKYIALETGQLEEGKISSTTVAGDVARIASIKISPTDKEDTVSVRSDELPVFGKFELYVPSTKTLNTVEKKIFDFGTREGRHIVESDIGFSSRNFHAEIEKNCPNIVAYVADLNKAHVTHDDRELGLLNECSYALVTEKFLGTIVHEMGHNFGLRHNFMGSNDEANFWSKDETGTDDVVRSSSTMEYPSFNEDRLVKPGKYDIAAIRFGYVNQVELADGKIVTVDPTKTIAQNVGGADKLRPYKFCTDEDVDTSDPMCQRHDAGVTPEEVVKNIISDYEASYQYHNYRRDRITTADPDALAANRFGAYYVPLAQFYQQWRKGIARFLGQDEQYLEHYSADQLNAVIAQMAQDPQFAEFTKLYKPAADAAFNFFMKIANMSNRYCVVETDDGKAGLSDAKNVSLVELEKAREQLFFLQKTVAHNCEEVAPLLKSKGLKVDAEIGHDVNTFRYDLSPRALEEPLDVIGSQADRANALVMLTLRAPLSAEAEIQGFFPSFMDEPAYREKVKGSIISRIADGVDSSTLLETAGRASVTDKLQTALAGKKFVNFSSESLLVRLGLARLLSGVQIPGRPDATSQRLSSLRGMYVTNPADIPQGAQALSVGAGYFVLGGPQATDAMKLAVAYSKAQQLRKSDLIAIDSPEIKALIDALSTSLPTKAEVEAGYTVGQMQQMLESINTVMVTALQKQQKSTLALFGDILQIVFPELQAIGELQAKPEGKAEADQRLATPISQLFEAQGAEYALFKDDVAAKSQAKADTAKANVDKYSNNRVEYDAQVDVLTWALKTLGGASD